jgi:V8-like Glu-specific endopeptidase
MKKLVILCSLALFSALSFCKINAVFAQSSGIPSPIDGQPITDEPTFNLGFGVDDRIPMTSNSYPWSAVGRVQTDDAGHCTGALIGRDLVLTNAHCIFVDGQQRGITFAPNYKNGQSPETVRGTFYWWGTKNPNQNRNADWAIIRLERPIGDRYGWFGYHPLNYQELRGRKVSYVGYSVFGNEKVQAFINGETAQAHIGCQIRDVFPDPGLIHTDCDNGRGGSGGPIFIWQNNKPYIVGINAAEFRGDPDGQSFFTQNYTPGRGNVGVPTLTFSQTIKEANSSTSSPQLSSADLCWYQHSGWQSGSIGWANNNCTKVGSGWSFKTVFASSDGVIYGINANNELLWYKHNGWQNGSPSWATGTGTKVGSGWSFKTVFASSDGVIYGINANNELLWYKHNGWQNGSASWATGAGTKVGSGWNFKAVFATNNGIIYAIRDNGDLLWYKHNGWQDGSTSFAAGSGTKVGSVWNFKTVFASSDGVIYGIKDNGDLHWYKHNGLQDGSTSFMQGSGTKVGSGWNFRTAFATSNGSIYGVVK